MTRLIFLLFLLPTYSQAARFIVGVAKVDITPYAFELRPIVRSNRHYKFGDEFFDTGTDQKFDFEEKNAFGWDEQPGVAGIDDDGDGKIDNCSREACGEYLAPLSDDEVDPASDNYSRRNPKGTEGNQLLDYVHLGGFSPFWGIFAENRMALGVHDPVWARAIYVRDKNDTQLLMISTDLPGLVWKYINPAKRKISRLLDIPYENIVIASTHNHAGPDAADYWSILRKNLNKPYTDQLQEWLFDVALKALTSSQAAKLRVITTDHVGCIDPRTKLIKRPKDCRIAKSQHDPNRLNPEFYDLPLLQYDKRDPVTRNTDIVVAQFVSEYSNKTLGTLINWSTHPDTLGSNNMLISSDFIHYIRKYVERYLGGIAVYFSGTVGCQITGDEAKAPLWTENMERVYEIGQVDTEGNPVPKLVGPERSWQKTRSIGYEVGHEVVKALSDTKLDFEKNPLLKIKTEPVDTQVRNGLHIIGTKRVWHENVEPEDKMHFYFPHCGQGWGCVRSDISVIQLGNLTLVTAPGEVDPIYFFGREEWSWEYGEHGVLTYDELEGWKDYMPGQHKAVLGQANNYLSYLLRRNDNVGWLNTNHPEWYEDFVTVDKDLGDDIGNKIMQMLGSDFRYSENPIFP